MRRAPDDELTTNSLRADRGARQRKPDGRPTADRSRRSGVPARRRSQRSHAPAGAPSAPAPRPTLRLIRSYDPVDDLQIRLRRIYTLLSVPSLDPPDQTRR